MNLPPLAEFESPRQRAEWMRYNYEPKPRTGLLIAATVCLASFLPLLWLFLKINEVGL